MPRDGDPLVREALLESVRAHLIADVPVGAFLSAGVDSGALVGLMRDAGADDLQTVTIAFEEFRDTPADEAPLAASVAARYGTCHTARTVTRDEFEADLPRIIAAMDQPSVDGINTWFVSKAARELGLKVAISGLGGDELFGGYPSFRDLPRWVRAFALPGRVPLLGSAARRLAVPIAPRLGFNPKAAGMIELGGTWAGAYLLRRGLFMPWELSQVLDRDTIHAGLRRLAPFRLINDQIAACPRQPFARAATLETTLYMRNQLLRDTDWASMAHSLEVRVPLVDGRLLSNIAPFAGSGSVVSGKRLLATAPRRPLPAGILGRPKTGFTTPIDGWMRTRLRDWHRASGRSARSAPAGSPWARDWSVLVRELSEAAAC
jgi:asparagine synthase (glutamine-hydrolysing)